MKYICIVVLMVSVAAGSSVSAELQETAGPSTPYVAGIADYRGNLVVLPNGSWRVYDVIETDGLWRLTVRRSLDNGLSWTERENLYDMPGKDWGGAVSLLDRDSEIHLFFMKWRSKEGRKPGVDRFIDLWHMRSHDGKSQWSEPQRIFKGYCGSIQDAVQLRSERIVLPFAKWMVNRPCAPPTGCNVTTTVFSDDGGKTWVLSDTELTAPCYTNFNGNNYGAVEPAVIELSDGRVWMLVRSQAGYLYESFSRDGDNWEPLRQSRFHSSTSPAFLLRAKNGGIVLFWNNCEMPPRFNGDGVYGGRDALHAALSLDEGQTWQGYREVYCDPARNDTPPKRGDRGTAYPFAAAMKDGRIALVSGQGAGKSKLIIVDPDWLIETGHADDFADGLDNWSVFKSFGPAQGWWRDREQGPRLIDNTENVGAKAIHIRKPDDKAGDCAIWNFPAAHNGRLTLQLKLAEGFGGATIALADRFFNPTDINGERKALFNLTVDSEGKIPGGGTIKPGQMLTVTLSWNSERRFCRVMVDGETAALLPLLNNTVAGASYLRLASGSNSIDPLGWFVESVEVVTGIDVPLEAE